MPKNPLFFIEKPQQKIDPFLSCYEYVTCRLKVFGVNVPHIVILKDKAASTTTYGYLSTLILPYVVMESILASVVTVPKKVTILLDPNVA